MNLKNKSLPELEKIADFYVIDVSDLFDNPKDAISKSVVKLDHKSVCKEDFESISRFGRIIKNYKKMIEMAPLSEKRDRKINNLLND